MAHFIDAGSLTALCIVKSDKHRSAWLIFRTMKSHLHPVIVTHINYFGPVCSAAASFLSLFLNRSSSESIIISLRQADVCYAIMQRHLRRQRKCSDKLLYPTEKWLCNQFKCDERLIAWNCRFSSTPECFIKSAWLCCLPIGNSTQQLTLSLCVVRGCLRCAADYDEAA